MIVHRSLKFHRVHNHFSIFILNSFSVVFNHSISNSLSLNLSFLRASHKFYSRVKSEASKTELGIISDYFYWYHKAPALPVFHSDWNFMLSFKSLPHPSPANLCQMSSLTYLSFSNLSLPFHSYFRPTLFSICFKSGHKYSHPNFRL